MAAAMLLQYHCTAIPHHQLKETTVTAHCTSLDHLQLSFEGFKRRMMRCSTSLDDTVSQSRSAPRRAASGSQTIQAVSNTAGSQQLQQHYGVEAPAAAL
jgi:hypothetical protein